MPDVDPEVPEAAPRESYSYRDRPETSRQVWWNRISVTAGLFCAAMSSAFLLGRKR